MLSLFFSGINHPFHSPVWDGMFLEWMQQDYPGSTAKYSIEKSFHEPEPGGLQFTRRTDRVWRIGLLSIGQTGKEPVRLCVVCRYCGLIPRMLYFFQVLIEH